MSLLPGSTSIEIVNPAINRGSFGYVLIDIPSNTLSPDEQANALCGPLYYFQTYPYPLTIAACYGHIDVARLLLEYGAVESKEDQKRWEIRERTDMNEKAWLKNFHRDDR